MNKRGEPTTVFYIVTTVLVILAFLIVAALLFRLNIKDSATDQSCKLSVLTRATAYESINNVIPLQCTTRKICFTTKWPSFRGECQEFIGESNVEIIHLSTSDDKAIEEIEKTTAEAMLRCWNLMGEGKLNLFSGGLQKELGLKPEQLSCVICDRIAFDIDEERKLQILPKVNINEYMKNKVIQSTGETYLQTFTDKSVRAYPSIPENINLLEEASKVENVKVSQLQASSTEELSIVFTQIRTQTYTETLSNLGKIGVVAAGATFFSPGVGKLAGAATKTVPGALAIAITSAGVTTFSMLNTYQGQVAAATYCGTLTTTETEAKNKEGCSSIQVLPYKFNEINQICQRIEGLP